MTNEFAVPSGAPVAGLSEVERVVDTFLAPSKTFTDILRSATWWLPAILLIVMALATSYTVDKQVGFERVTENAIHQSPKREQAMADATPEARAQQMKMATAMTKGISYGIPVVLLIGFAIYALILWACFNFILGAQTTFWQVLATCFYASLPYLVLDIIVIATLHFGGNADAYNYQNPAGTNLAYYMPDAAPWLKALLARFDLIQLWIVGLTAYGMAIISKKTLAQSLAVVGTLWLIMTLVAVAGGAFS